MQPEALARAKIDTLLSQAGWLLQDYQQFNRTAGSGVAVREFPLPNGAADYALFVDGKMAGIIEAKKAGYTLSGVLEQSGKYLKIPAHLRAWSESLTLHYESNGEEHQFTNRRDPKPRAHKVFTFHTPQALQEQLQQVSTLRQRLQHLPALAETGLRTCQFGAITALETSLANDKPRALIQMATGAGKTFTACSFAWRLAEFAKAKRILFLVDRNNLGDQTLKEFQNYQPPGSARAFTDTYVTQHLHSNRIDPDAKVVITTIQRLYSLLKGRELDPELEEESAFEHYSEQQAGEIMPLEYNPAIPIDSFDFIIVDECHRSIYGLWRQVLDYFDAYLIGLTATPSSHTLGFFNQNLVSEYTYDQSVIDGVNVGYETYRIRTRITDKGSRIKVQEANYIVPVRDKLTRQMLFRRLDSDLQYGSPELDRSVLAPNQIRTVLDCFRKKLFADLFPNRSGQWVPKTLIFAKDDHHAEEIVQIAKEVFNEGNDFIKKITYRNSEEKPRDMIKQFRMDTLPRIAVTVDMIATGTDIKPVEVLLFMRDVRSESYYEQMRGRGVRSIRHDDLLQVTPDAETKTRFVLVDAVGVEESKKHVSRPLERKRSVDLKTLLTQVAQGSRDEDTLTSLAGRFAARDKRLEASDQERIVDVSGGKTLVQIARELLDCVDPDFLNQAVFARYGEMAKDAEIRQVHEAVQDSACEPVNLPAFRQLILTLKAKNDIIIDEISTDEVLTAEFDQARAQQTVDGFRGFMEANRDHLTALQILYNQPYGKQQFTYASLRELAQRMAEPPLYLTTADVWQAYRRLQDKTVKGTPVDDVLAEIVSLLRFAIGQESLLEPFGKRVEQRFNLWLGREKKAGREYDGAQLEWLGLIRNHLAANVEIKPKDMLEMPAFTDKGGLLEARKVLGSGLNGLLDVLTEALVA
jgi:type I restriction enzyme R subunit